MMTGWGILGGLVVVVALPYVVAALARGFGRAARDKYTLEAEAESLWAAAQQALARLGAGYTPDWRRRTIQAWRGASWRSFGETLVVRISASAESPGAWTVTVESRSSLPWVLIDWGQNRRNVRAYFQYLAEELARASPSSRQRV